MGFEPCTSHMTEIYTNSLLYLPPLVTLQLEVFIRRCNHLSRLYFSCAWTDFLKKCGTKLMFYMSRRCVAQKYHVLSQGCSCWSNVICNHLCLCHNSIAWLDFHITWQTCLAYQDVVSCYRSTSLSQRSRSHAWCAWPRYAV